MPKLAKNPLTEKMCAELVKPRKGYIEKPDGIVRGLRFKISCSGLRSYILSYRVNGKQSRALVGHWPQMDLVEARRVAQAARDSGEPGAFLGVTSNEPEVVLFADLAEKYLDLGLIKQSGPEAGERLRSAPRYEDIVRNVLMPVWGDRAVESLTKRDATILTDSILRDQRKGRGGQAAARLTHSVYMRVFNWGLGRGEIDQHPFAGLPAPAPKRVRDRSFDDDEIAALWKGSLEIDGPVGPLYRMLILTGQRLSEVTDLTWSELDLKGHVWRIPGSRTKNALDHEVPLSTLAVTEFEAMKRGPRGDFVFSLSGGRRALNSPNKMKQKMDLASGVSDWRNHDIRRTVRSQLAALGVPEVVSERILNHAERDQMVKAYNVHKYRDEKRDALERWAQRVREIVTPPPENVTKLRATR